MVILEHGTKVSENSNEYKQDRVLLNDFSFRFAGAEVLIGRTESFELAFQLTPQ